MGIARRALLVAVLTTTASCGAPEPTVSDEARARSGDRNLTNANLRGADLTRANLSGANLRGADLVLANLSGADLNSANLSGATLTRADLTGANLSLANLTRAGLSDANLTGANLTVVFCNTSTRWPRDFRRPTCVGGR